MLSLLLLLLCLVLLLFCPYQYHCCSYVYRIMYSLLCSWLQWLDACLELHAQACQQQAAAAPAQASSNTSATPAAAAGAKGGGGTVPALLAPIVGATNMAAREKSAKEAAARQGVEGEWLCGWCVIGQQQARHLLLNHIQRAQYAHTAVPVGQPPRLLLHVTPDDMLLAV